MKTFALGLTTALAAGLTACITTTAEDAGPGSCGTQSQSCSSEAPCCTGFTCVGGVCAFTAGNTAGTTGGGGSGGGTSGGTNGGSTGNGCLNASGTFNEYATCSSSSTCDCPMSCVSSSTGSYCVESCSSASTCPGIFDTCTSGYCVPNEGCTATQLCTDVASDDGTCIEVSSSGQSLGVCFRGGSIPVGSACNLNSLDPTASPAPASALCVPGAFCDGAPGVCVPVCDVGTSGACASGQTCTTLQGFASSFGVCEPTGGSTGGTSTSSGGTGGFTPAPHQSFPQMEDNGIPPIAVPQLVTLSFSGYESTYPVGTFADWLVISPWLQTVGTPYGIGTGSHLDVPMTATGPSSTSLQDSDIQSFIWNYVSDAGSSLPQPSGTPPSTVYMVYYPQDVTITLSTGTGSAPGTSCTDFGGYHNSFTDAKGQLWVYAVIPTCPDFDPNLTSTLQDLEFASSHEFIEALTDPTLETSPPYEFGYALYGDTTDSWGFDLGEVADLCVGAPIATYGSDVATEVWDVVGTPDSDSSPCQPWPSGEVYFNVSPVAAGGSNGLAEFSSSNVPGTVTFNITGWSNASTSDWYVFPAQTVGTFQLSTSDMTLSGGTGGGGQYVTMNNGSTATLTVTLPSGLTAGDYATIELVSTQNTTSGYPYSEWPVAIAIGN